MDNVTIWACFTFFRGCPNQIYVNLLFLHRTMCKLEGLPKDWVRQPCDWLCADRSSSEAEDPLNSMLLSHAWATCFL